MTYLSDLILFIMHVDEGGDNEILKSSDNLEGDEVYQQQQYSSRLRSNHPSGAAGAGSSSRGNGVSAQGGDDSSEDEELFMLNGEFVTFARFVFFSCFSDQCIQFMGPALGWTIRLSAA